jgi:hypothetical protein
MIGSVSVIVKPMLTGPKRFAPSPYDRCMPTIQSGKTKPGCWSGLVEDGKEQFLREQFQRRRDRDRNQRSDHAQ